LGCVALQFVMQEKHYQNIYMLHSTNLQKEKGG
jgi:hypothetical protein